MICVMFRTILKKFKVLNPVVSLVPVFMVDNFYRREESPQVLLHHQTMFSNISKSVSAWMLGGQNKTVALPKSYSAFPSSMLNTTCSGMSKFMSVFKKIGVAFYRAVFTLSARECHKRFSAGSARKSLLCFLALVNTLSRTVFTFSPYFGAKSSSAYFASVFHNTLQNKKAVFSGLEKTVRFSRLLTAFRNPDIKNPFSLSNTIIYPFIFDVKLIEGEKCQPI